MLCIYKAILLGKANGRPRGLELLWSIYPKRLLHLFSIYSSPCSKQNFVSFDCVLSLLTSHSGSRVFDFLMEFAQAFISLYMSSLVSGHVLLKSEFTYGPWEVTGWWEPVCWDNTSFSLLSDLYAVPWTKYPTQWPSQLSWDVWHFRILKQLYFSLSFFSQSPGENKLCRPRSPPSWIIIKSRKTCIMSPAFLPEEQSQQVGFFRSRVESKACLFWYPLFFYFFIFFSFQVFFF